MATKKNIRDSSYSVGSWISSGSLIIADVMSQSGVDWLVLDNEHSTMSMETLHSLIVQIQKNQCQCFVRVGANNTLLIKKFLDAGANGIIVPMIKSLEDALQAVQNTYYPPTGSRGVGLYSAQDYGYSFENYVKKHVEETILILQIEHIDALRDLEKMVQIPNVAGFMLGPYDLSASLGVPGEFENKLFLEAVEKVESVVKKSKKLLGVHVVQPDHKQMLDKLKLGYNFIAFSLDFLILANKLRDELKLFKDGVK